MEVKSWVMFKMLKQWFQDAFWKSSAGQEPETSYSEVEFLKEYYIPDYILLADSEVKQGYGIPECPLIVFANTRSGGQLGGEVLQTCRKLLNKNQVFDLVEREPETVLHQIFSNLEKHKQNGDIVSTEILKRLRIVVAGGDGTAGWIFRVVSELKLTKQPPIATLPLGTGNNIPFSFGWGKKNPGTDVQSVKALLEQVKCANEMQIDSWHIAMNMKDSGEGSVELPQSLHPVHRASRDVKLNNEGFRTFHGGFWNYFSMGMDAQVSYAFHSERKQHPEKFKNQLANQRMYAKFTCVQGWFCASFLHPSSRNIAQLANVKIMKRPGEWIDLHIPKSIRSIICLNLPSFSGGLNPWGSPSRKKLHSRDLTPPYVDDGLFEVVGFRDGWHGLILFAPNGHGTRLAQANGIRFEFHKGAANHAFMRVDGEPWKQPLPVAVDNTPVVIEISHSGQVSVLATSTCPSNSSSTPFSPRRSYKRSGDTEEILVEKKNA